MRKVITYGTYDLLHYGHIRLLKRAKKLGDYLIVGVTSDDFDRKRGKINVQQSLAERIEAVRKTGIADQIIVEEYEGQKIDDIKRYGVDVFTVGSDWEGYFDYLKEYCEVHYLERTEGISSSEIRDKERKLTMGIVGEDSEYLNKFQAEDKYVNGIEIIGICTKNIEQMNKRIKNLAVVTDSYDELLKHVDSVFIYGRSKEHYKLVLKALKKKKHVLCETPLTLNKQEAKELVKIAKENKLVLMESIRTAYATAYSRLLLLVKSGRIGNVVSVDVTCTSLRNAKDETYKPNSFVHWGSNALLPIFQILGTNYKEYRFITKYNDEKKEHDSFTKVNFLYENAIASLTVAEEAKSEGDLVITGTKGYIYVPAPWWKTDYFEIRYENPNDNKRMFYNLDGEGIRNELVAFTRAIQDLKKTDNVEEKTSIAIAEMMENFIEKRNLKEI